MSALKMRLIAMSTNPYVLVLMVDQLAARWLPASAMRSPTPT